MAGKKSSEDVLSKVGKKVSERGYEDVIKFIRENEWPLNLVNVDDLQVRIIIAVYQELKSKSTGESYIDADISSALKGLKAVQREARKTTQALKELEREKEDKYLVIELDELGDVPRVLYKGKEITNKKFIDFRWTTKSDVPGSTDITVDYFERDKGKLKTKSIREGIRS